jgi:hypothetical protein
VLLRPRLILPMMTLYLTLTSVDSFFVPVLKQRPEINRPLGDFHYEHQVK